MPSAWILCPIVFAPSYLGLVLSLRDVESRRRSWCPEIASDYFALTFSVSRGPFRIFVLMRPAAGLNFWVLRCPAAVWPSNVVDEHLGGAPPPGLGLSKRTSGHRRRDRDLFVCFYIPGEPMISMVFLRALLSAVSCFPMRSARPRGARDVQALQGVQEDDQDTHHHARDLRRLRGARGPQRVRDGSSIFKCPEVG